MNETLRPSRGIIKEGNDRRSRFPACIAIHAQSISVSRSATLVARHANVGAEQTVGARHRKIRIVANSISAKLLLLPVPSENIGFK